MQQQTPSDRANSTEQEMISDYFHLECKEMKTLRIISCVHYRAVNTLVSHEPKQRFNYSLR